MKLDLQFTIAGWKDQNWNKSSLSGNTYLLMALGGYAMNLY